MSIKSFQNGDEVLRKGPWMPEEDEILVEYVRQFGARDWSSIRTKGLLPRTGKSCRLRWVNKLKPDLKRSGCKFSSEEEKLVVEMQAKLGNKWAKIASCLPGRTDNDVKNFWSTRQKRILRALQRPKMPSGSTDASADTSDLTNDQSLIDFGAFQVHSPCSATPLIGSGIRPHFIFTEDGDSKFKEAAATNIRHCHMHCHHVHTFSSLEADKILNSHKFLKPFSAGDMISYTLEKDHLLTSMEKELVETKPIAYLHVQPLSVAFPCANMASRTIRSIKRRPRSRRDMRSPTILSCFEQPIVDPIDNCHIDGATALLSEMNSNNFSNPNSLCHTTSIDSATLLQQNDNHLEFLLQSDGSIMQNNVQIFSPELNPLHFTNTQQWEKLPMLYPEDNLTLCGGCNIKEVDSYSPDSVITNFTPDVFDSLEPLNSAPLEWWVVH